MYLVEKLVILIKNHNVRNFIYLKGGVTQTLGKMFKKLGYKIYLQSIVNKYIL